MATLSAIEKFKFEKLFGMSSGYVLDFSNRTFQEFILDSTGIDIYDEKYNYWSGSKANRLRAFWDKEPNWVTGKLLKDLLEYWGTKNFVEGMYIDDTEKTLYRECLSIAERLMQDHVEGLETIDEYANLGEFSILAKSIRESITRNEPETALDRLHTFVVKYVKRLCQKHHIPYDNKIPLHGLFGTYVKYLRDKRYIESGMSERILKTSIRILEDFNHVRNNQSLAHDSPLLNKNESILIFNSVMSILRFIEAIEKEHSGSREIVEEVLDFDDIPF